MFVVPWASRTLNHKGSSTNGSCASYWEDDLSHTHLGMRATLARKKANTISSGLSDYTLTLILRILVSEVFLHLFHQVCVLHIPPGAGEFSTS